MSCKYSPPQGSAKSSRLDLCRDPGQRTADASTGLAGKTLPGAPEPAARSYGGLAASVPALRRQLERGVCCSAHRCAAWLEPAPQAGARVNSEARRGRAPKSCQGIVGAPCDRAISRAFSLRRKLGDDGEIGDYVTKPKGMHRRTFERAMGKIDRAEGIVDGHAVLLLDRLNRVASR